MISDLNVSQRKSKVTSMGKPYSDLDLSLTLHPDFHDIVPLTDIDAVKNAVRILILSNFYDRPFWPTKAANLGALLFEPADKFTAILFRHSIKHVLAVYEPRIDRVTVEIIDDSQENGYKITIGFRVISVNTLVNVPIYLSRIR